ncbi:hypothetical protein, partial [Acinetobacter baumannii]|uniref:hypothetical protein n=1 Tax=Acinetobacter baumannii TaxID=470 RepID=UPI00165FC6A6
MKTMYYLALAEPAILDLLSEFAFLFSNATKEAKFASILPITNKHLQDMPENDARAKFHVDKQAWIDLTAKLAQQGS